MKRFQSLDTGEQMRTEEKLREMETRKEGLCVARLTEQGGGVYFPRMSWAMEGL